MQSVALLLTFALATPIKDAPLPADESAAGTAAAFADGAPVEQVKAPSARRVWGVALLAGGSAVLAASATSAALVEAITRPDDPDDELEHPEVLQGIAFGTMVVAAASAGAMLAGGALIASE